MTTQRRLVGLATAAGVAFGVLGALLGPAAGANDGEARDAADLPGVGPRAGGRSRRVRLAGGTAVAIAAVIVAVLVSSASPGTVGPAPAGAVSAWDMLLAGIPQSGSRLGDPAAPVTLDYYGDLECPVCQAFNQAVFPRLVTQLVRTGRLQIVYRALQTATRDPATFMAQQVAVLAAGRQNKAWYYIDLFYSEQGKEGTDYVDTAYLDRLAAQVPGLNLASWQAARSDPVLAEQIRSDAQAAAALGSSSTPTLVAAGPGGRRTIVGLVPYTTVLALVESVSCGPASPCVARAAGVPVSYGGSGLRGPGRARD